MKKLFVAMAALAWLGAAISAEAADRRPASIPKAPVSEAADWSGMYIGIDAGLQATRSDLTTIGVLTVGPFLAPFAFAPGGATTLPYDGTGFRMAGVAGYNWQVARQWVLGFEGVIGWSDNKTTLGGVAVPALFCCATVSFSSSVRTDWDASLRARVGVLLTPGFLAYVTGGVAWQHFEQLSSCGPPFCAAVPPPGLTFVPFSFENGFTKAGWSIGGGVETMLWPNWFARASYRYANFGTVTFNNTDVVTGGVAGGTTTITSTLDLKVRTHTASMGVVYKLGGPDVSTSASLMPAATPIYKERPAAPGWTGFYVGLSAGLFSTLTDVTTTSAFVNGVPNDFTNFATSAPLNGRGFGFGPFAGHNWQVAPQWVVGLETDWSWARGAAALPGFPFTPGFFTSGVANDALAVRTTWVASARGRIGYLLSPTLLAYVTGGGAWLHYDVESDCPGLCSLPITTLGPTIITGDTTKAGWTVGAGFESWLWDRWFARAEYRYADFGTEAFTLTRTGPAWSRRSSTISTSESGPTRSRSASPTSWRTEAAPGPQSTANWFGPGVWPGSIAARRWRAVPNQFILNGFQIKRGQIFAGRPCDSLGLGNLGSVGGFGGMRRLALWLSLVPAVLVTTCAFADYRITRDHGGYVHEYKAKYAAIRDRGERVIIDGICNSACTLVFGIVPLNRVCVTPRASLGFHMAYYDQASTFGVKVTSYSGTADLMSYYPETVKDWIARNGGLTPQMKKVKNGPALWAMIDPCPEEF